MSASDSNAGLERMLTTEQVDALLIARATARARKDFNESDRIRDLLRAKGIVVIDTPSGQKANAGKDFEREQELSREYSMAARVEFLEHSVTVLLRREHGYSERICELVKENLSLKYGSSNARVNPVAEGDPVSEANEG